MPSRLVESATRTAAQAIDTLARLGEHAWRSTQDMEPGVRAGSLDPMSRGWRHEVVEGAEGPEVAAVPNDPTGEAAVAVEETSGLHERYRRLLRTAIVANEALVDFLGSVDPTRRAYVVAEETTTDADWCRLHLDIGVCEPRYRGDLCNWCYKFQMAHDGATPPRGLLELRRERGKITQADIDRFLNPPRMTNPQSKRGRRRARRRGR